MLPNIATADKDKELVQFSVNSSGLGGATATPIAPAGMQEYVCRTVWAAHPRAPIHAATFVGHRIHLRQPAIVW